MKMDIGLQLKLGQNLIMTPQLQQAIKLLQLSRHELESLIEQSLVENPALEIQERSDEVEDNAESGTLDAQSEKEFENEDSNRLDGMNDDDWSDYIQSGAGQIYEDFRGGKDGEEHNILENTVTKKQTLATYLFSQIDLTFSDEDEKEMARAFVSFLNEDGYLTSSLREIIVLSPKVSAILHRLTKGLTINLSNYNTASFDEKYPVHDKEGKNLQAARLIISSSDADDEAVPQDVYVADPEKVSQVPDIQCYFLDQVLKKFQLLDPNGIGARNLRECLMIQLEVFGLQEDIPYQILKKDYNSLIKNDLQRLQRKYDVSHDKIQEACRLIKQLEPKPGRPYTQDNTQYIIPDVFIYKKQGKYVVHLNSETLPNLRISPYYAELAKQQQIQQANAKKKKLSGDENEDLTGAYLNEKIKAGEWLIKSIDQRQRTIFKVAESILKNQKDFFENGISELKPMILKDVAADIGVHESTVSRITNNKFMHTPQGIFELKYFFTSGITQQDGDAISSKKIKNLIQHLVQSENLKKPYTDHQLAIELEKKEGIEIARRTVAKYRESLNILPSNRRKRLF